MPLFLSAAGRSVTMNEVSRGPAGPGPLFGADSASILTTMTPITSSVRTDLAPTGTLRAGINYGNFILATRSAATGESRGVAIELSRELARRLTVRVDIVAYDSVAM